MAMPRPKLTQAIQLKKKEFILFSTQHIVKLLLTTSVALHFKGPGAHYKEAPLYMKYIVHVSNNKKLVKLTYFRSRSKLRIPFQILLQNKLI